jgi:methylisocitrate lyase
MADEKDFEAFRKAIQVPLLANMTEFGKSKLLSRSQLEALGMNLVIYPQTAFRLASKAVEDGLAELQKAGTQEGLVPKMQTRARLYEVIRYKDYNAYDQDLFNFKL